MEVRTKVGGRLGVGRRRMAIGLIFAATALATLTVVLVATRDEFSVPMYLSLYLLVVIVATVIGGGVPGIVSAGAAPLLANWYLIPPYHTLRINERDNLIELGAFISMAAIVAVVVSEAARRTSEARAATREASTLAALATSATVDPIVTILQLMRDTFGFTGVSIDPDPAVGTTEETDARGPMVVGLRPSSSDDSMFRRRIAGGFILTADGVALSASDQRVVGAFVDQLSLALEQRRLREKALRADSLARADELRTAILRTVSHDLRSPLSGIKASVSSLRQSGIVWPEAAREEFLASIESETDRLNRIVANLLDMSRLEVGVLRPAIDRVSFEEVVPEVVLSLGDDASRVEIDVPEGTPDAWADAALLERVVDNLVQNALKWSPDGVGVQIRATTTMSDVRLHVIDHGPGIPAHMRERVTQPFHRIDDSAPGGLGLGLAIAERLLSAMSGSLRLTDTPGGGLTAIVSLRRTWTEAP